MVVRLPGEDGASGLELASEGLVVGLGGNRAALDGDGGGADEDGVGVQGEGRDVGRTRSRSRRRAVIVG